MDQLNNISKRDFTNFLGIFLTEHFLTLAKDNVDRAIEDSHSFYAFVLNKFIDNENKEYKFLSSKVRAKSDKDSVFLEHEDFYQELDIKSLALPIKLDRILGTESYRLGFGRFRPVFDDLDFINHLKNRDAKCRQRHEIQSYLFEEDHNAFKDTIILRSFRERIRSLVLRQIESEFEYLLYLKDDESILLADCLKTDSADFINFGAVEYYSHDSICSREQVLNIINNALAKDGYSDVYDILNTMLNSNSAKKRLMKLVDYSFKKEIEKFELNFEISPTINQYVLSRFDDLSQSKNAIDFTSWCFFACVCSAYLECNHSDRDMGIQKGISANSKIILDILSYDSNKSWLDDMFGMVDSNWGNRFKYENENTYMSISPNTNLKYLEKTTERFYEIFQQIGFSIISMFDFECSSMIEALVLQGDFLPFENCNYVYMGSYNTRCSSTLILYDFFSMNIVRPLLAPFCENFKEAVIVINMENL